MMIKTIFSCSSNKTKNIKVENKTYKDLTYYVRKGNIYIDGAKGLITHVCFGEELQENIYKQIKEFGDIAKKEIEIANKKIDSGLELQERKIDLRNARITDRRDECIKHNKIISDKKEKQKEIEERNKIENDKRKKEEEKVENEKSKQKFIEGEKIPYDRFLSLCDMYDIKVPLRTRGYILDKVYSVYIHGYTSEGMGTSQSIYKVINKLLEKIK